jgi:D-alanyl-D-alanine carboxypeptidase
MTEVVRLLTAEVEKQNTPSVQYLFFSADSVLYNFNAGFANIRGSKKTNDKTAYHAFSVTKTFTALAILQLAEQGKLVLNDAVNKYLPEFPYAPAITLKQLLNHSAGIPNPLPLNWIHLVHEHDSFDRDDFFKYVFIRNKRTGSYPNERFAYSNLGYVILGQVIEKIAGISYERYIEENVLKKIELESGDLGFTTTSISQNAIGYHKRVSFSNLVLGLFMDKAKYMGAKEGKWRAFRDFYVNGPSYGGLIGNASAFARYVQELLITDCALLTNEYKRMLFTENFTNSGKATGMCLSWFKGELNGRQYFAHAGGGGGYYCEIRIYPELGVGSVIMFNRTGMTDERFLDKVDKYFFK